jgi:DivIVA domain-containing protein
VAARVQDADHEAESIVSVPAQADAASVAKTDQATSIDQNAKLQYIRNKRFRMARKSGYEVLEVDEFVDWIEEQYARRLDLLARLQGSQGSVNSQSDDALLVTQEIAIKRFKIARKSGYEVLEVDEFVDEMEELFSDQDKQILSFNADRWGQSQASASSPGAKLTGRLAKPRGQPAKQRQTTPVLLVGGRYELGELLGRGGMAEVRRAVDQRLGRSVAVKQLRTDLATDPAFQARFRREAQSAAGLNHPTIVAVYDTGEEIDPLTGVSIPYIVMELVEGPTLRDVLRDGRKILPERALELTQGILDALSYSHKAGIVHRDIKPANVMLTPYGGVKVMDFGIARAVADTSATMTQTAAVIGTAQYLSPEQARGETVDARSDLYSAGCVLYELLLGRPPFVGDSPVSVAYQHVREAPQPPSQLDPEITPEIDAVVLKTLAKDPADRYQSAGEMKADIARLLSGQRPTAS